MDAFINADYNALDKMITEDMLSVNDVCAYAINVNTEVFKHYWPRCTDRITIAIAIVRYQNIEVLEYFISQNINMDIIILHSIYKSNAKIMKFLFDKNFITRNHISSHIGNTIVMFSNIEYVKKAYTIGPFHEDSISLAMDSMQYDTVKFLVLQNYDIDHIDIPIVKMWCLDYISDNIKEDFLDRDDYVEMDRILNSIKRQREKSRLLDYPHDTMIYTHD